MHRVSASMKWPHRAAEKNSECFARSLPYAQISVFSGPTISVTSPLYCSILEKLLLASEVSLGLPLILTEPLPH
jgi:hypothetical protein